ncbi:MAG: DNA-binding transcriptional LysR family regulator [Gammaproteobacteria bacterium]|jgi:DNA-binding transcriptional LysR family regulator
MDRLQTMATFVAVAEEQSFSSAARRLNISPPVVTRAVAELEQRLGIKLLNRTTRYVRPTEAGLRYVEDARRILEEIELADEAAIGINANPRGSLVVTAPVLFGRMHVVPGIVDYLNRYPETSIRALFLDRVVNMVEEGIDVGIRIGELPDSSMRALKVGAVRMVTVASPAYLKKFGVAQSPKDLSIHTTIASSAADNFIGWQFKTANEAKAFRMDPRLIVSDNGAAIEAAKTGLGITRALSYQVAEYLADGELITILHDFEPPQSPIHIIHREGRNSSSKIRAFIDLIADRLRSDSRLM